MPYNYDAEWEEQASAPDTPSSGHWKIYHKSDGLYVLEDDGTEYGPLAAGDMLASTYDSDGDDDVDAAAGGTGIDSSGATGIPHVSSGTWSVEKPKRSYIFEGYALESGTTPPDSGTLGNYEFFLYDIGDDSVFNIPTPPGWEVGTDFTLRIRWAIDEAYATGSGEVQWRADWSATPNDESEALDSPTHSGQVDSGDQDIPATAKTLKQTDITIPGTNIAADDELGITLSRIAIGDGSDPTADPGIISVALVYTSDELGETA
jgi:hypothetical protein